MTKYHLLYFVFFPPGAEDQNQGLCSTTKLNSWPRNCMWLEMRHRFHAMHAHAHSNWFSHNSIGEEFRNLFCSFYRQFTLQQFFLNLYFSQNFSSFYYKYHDLILQNCDILEVCVGISNMLWFS